VTAAGTFETILGLELTPKFGSFVVKYETARAVVGAAPRSAFNINNVKSSSSDLSYVEGSGG